MCAASSVDIVPSFAMATPTQPTTTHDTLSRARLLRGLAAGSVVLATPATALSFLAGAADAAVPDGDLAWLRVLVGVELLSEDFHQTALASGKLGQPAAQVIKHLAGGDDAHYEWVAGLLTNAGQTPATADDIDFSYPQTTFATGGSTLRLGLRIETLSLGAYLGALGTVESADLRLPLAQIAASEGQHAGAVARLLGHPIASNPFPPALSIDNVSLALDAFES